MRYRWAVLARYLEVERIAVDASPDDKPAVLRELAALLCKPTCEVEQDQVLRALEHREALGGTAIGSEVAIPHGKLEQLTATRAAMLIHPRGVDFDAIDGEPVRIFVALVGPMNAPREHLTSLADVSRRLRNPVTRQRLLEAKTAADVYAIMAT